MLGKFLIFYKTTDKYNFYSIALTIIMLFTSAILFTIYLPQLPSKIPMFYSLPWGEPELVSLSQFFILLTAIATPLVIKIALKYGLVDNPKLRPHPAHIHKKIIPRAGGLAIYLSIVLAMLIFLPGEKYLVGIILGITILLTIGLIDD